MANFFNTAKNILKDHNYLNYKEIVDLATKRGGFHTDGKTPELTMSSRLGMDIRQKGVNSTFIRIGDGVFALRKPLKEDNLLVYLLYRLKSFPVWEIDDKDKKYLLDIFGRDIFEDEKIELFSLLKKLKDSGKINDFTIVDDNILVALKKEKKDYEDSSKEQIALLKSASEIGEGVISKEDLEKENEELKNKLGITVKWMRNEVEHSVKNIATRKIRKNILNETIKQIQKDTERMKELSESVNKSSGLQELTQNFQKIGEDLKNILPQVFANGLLGVNNKTLGQFEQLSTALGGMHKNPVFENFGKIISGIQENLKLYDISQLSKSQLDEFNALNTQIGFFSQMMTNPEDFFGNLTPKKSVGFSLPTVLPAKLGTNKQNYTHTFEGYLQEGDFKTIRGFAPIQDLAKISKAIYQSEGGVQRNENKDRCEKIKKYIESGSKRFFPEVTLGFYIGDNGAITEPSQLKDGRILIGKVEIKVDFNRIEEGQITRIDGNHRLFFGEEIKDDFLVPFCFIIFDQKGENKDLIETHKYQEANIFYLLNGKNVPISSEESLQVLLNMPDDEAQPLYQNDSTLGLTRLCKQKYEKYCCIPGDGFRMNFGDLPFTKFEKLVKEIEKLGLSNKKIDELLNSLFETIHPLGSKYEKIIKREDFLYLILFPVLENKEKEISERNEIVKAFFDWILKEGLEEISFSEKPILWELRKKNKSFKEVTTIHDYEIDEQKLNGGDKEVIYKEFVRYINESRIKILHTDINEKRIGLEKIVDAYSKLLDILGNGGTDNAGRVDKIIQKFYHSSGKSKMKAYLKDDFYDNLGKRVMNNDFAIRHHEANKESLEERQFIEFLYCEYDNAIKFILDKSGFLVR